MKGTAGRPSGVLEVEIILGDGNEQSWRLERHGPNPVEAFGALTVDAIELERIKEKSLRLSGEITGPQWMATLSELSSDLGKLLFQATNQNQEFWEKFVEFRAESGGQGQTRIRFTVNDATHPVFVEALKYGSDRKYWMLVSPIFRRYYRQNVSRPPLFQDAASERGPINCLVIAAEPKPGILGDKAFSLLRYLGTEAAKVLEVLARNKAHGNGDMDFFDLATVNGDRDQVVSALYEKLKEKPWHLVHFAGHVGVPPRALLGGKQSLSEQEKEDKASSLILSPSRKIALDVANFLNKLELTQFLFMSSCRSADGYVIASAARESIPAVLGFRWTVDDKKAAQFAERFYAQLFSQGRCFKSLEYAFRDARRLTYEADVNDPTWASPVLMMQLRQTHPA